MKNILVIEDEQDKAIPSDPTIFLVIQMPFIKITNYYLL